MVIIALTATPAVYIARRWIDKKDVAPLGLELGWQAMADVLFGFTVSGIMMVLVFVAMWALGYVGQVEVAAIGWSTARVLATSLVVMVLVGFWEELVFRGYLLQNMAEGRGIRSRGERRHDSRGFRRSGGDVGLVPGHGGTRDPRIDGRSMPSANLNPPIGLSRPRLARAAQAPDQFRPR